MRRLAQLDGIRGLAALYVVLHHAWLTIWPVEAGLVGAGAPTGTAVLAYGHFAVGIFIVLSGFVLATPIARAGWRLPGGARGFFGRRARRILPPYYAALAFALILIWARIGQETGAHWDISVPVDSTGVLASLLLVQNVLGQSQINHVFWSIAVETQIYLLFPLFVLVCLRRGVRTAIVLAAVIAAVLLALVTLAPVAGPVVLSGLTPQFLLLFALGAGAAAIVVGGQSPATIPWGRLALGGCILVAALCAMLGRDRVFDHLVALDLLVGATSAAALIALCREPDGRAARLFAARPVAGLGRFAYSTYLVHAPVLQLFWLSWIAPRRLDDAAQFTLLLAVGVPLALAVSYGFFLLFERPFLGRKPAGAALLEPERRGWRRASPQPSGEGERVAVDPLGENPAKLARA